MAEAMDYVNPIIQSMASSAQLSHERNKLKQQAQQFKENKDIEKMQLEQHLRQIEYEHEHAQEQTKLGQEQNALHAKQARANAILEAHKLILGGGNQAGANALLGQLGVQEPIDFSGTVNAAAEAQKLQAQAKAKGQGEGMAPFVQKQFENTIQLHNLDNTNRMEVAKVNRESAERIAKDANARALDVANLNGMWHLRGVQAMHAAGLGDLADTAKQITDGIFDGNIEWSKLTPDIKKVVTPYMQATGELNAVPTDNKAYAKRLDSLSSLQVLINQYRDLAANFSRDSKGSTVFGGTGNQNITIPGIGTIQRTQPGSDLESKLDSMKASGGQLATYFDQQNRKSDAEILRQVLGSFNPKSTMKENAAKLEQHIQQLQQAVKTTFGNMKPERVSKILEDRNITDFGANIGKKEGGRISVKRKSDGKTGTIDETDFDPSVYERR